MPAEPAKLAASRAKRVLVVASFFFAADEAKVALFMISRPQTLS
jgi:hypothetical protein